MILQDDMLEINVDGVKFISSPSFGVTSTARTFGNTVAAKSGFILDPDGISGWYDGVSVKRNATPRPVSWGDFAEPTQLSSRLVSATGTAIAGTAQELHQMRDKFTAILVEGSYSEMSVLNRSGVRYLTVGLESTPQWVQLSDNVAQWKISFYAPNPRIYGPEQRTQIRDTTDTGGLSYPTSYPLDYGKNSAPILISNEGNVDAWPVFTVTGDYFSGFKITNGRGREIVYTGMTTMQAPVTIDSAAGTVLQGGQDRSTELIKRQWFSIPPGGERRGISPVFQPTVDGPGWCDIIYRDTYI